MSSMTICIFKRQLAYIPNLDIENIASTFGSTKKRLLRLSVPVDFIPPEEGDITNGRRHQFKIIDFDKQSNSFQSTSMNSYRLNETGYKIPMVNNKPSRALSQKFPFQHFQKKIWET